MVKSYNVSRTESQEPVVCDDVTVADDTGSEVVWTADRTIRYSMITIAGMAWFGAVFFVGYYLNHPDKF